jgi:hypothetical protein
MMIGGSVVRARSVIPVTVDGDLSPSYRTKLCRAYVLAWLDRYARSGHDSVREHTRREYRWLLTTFALRHFDRELRLRDLGRAVVSAGSSSDVIPRTDRNLLPVAAAAKNAPASACSHRRTVRSPRS